VAVAPDLGGHAASVGERVAGGRRPVGVEAQHLAEVDGQVLRRVEFLPVPGGDEQVLPVRAEGQPMAVVARAARHRQLPPDHLEALKAGGRRVSGQPCAADHRTGELLPGSDPAEVDGAVGGERRPGHHVAKAALAAVHDGRHTLDGRLPAGGEVAEPQAAALEGYQEKVAAR